MKPLDQNKAHLTDQLTTAVITLDSQLQLSYLNPAAEMLLATSARLALTQTIERLLPGADELARALQRALTTGHAYTEREIQLELPNLHSITVDYTITPLEDGDPHARLLLEMTQVDRQLRIAREEGLLAQNHSVRSLLRGMAHEIKNPLGGLRGAAQLLERELPNEALKEYTQVIIGEADRLRNLLNQMLGPNTPPHKRRVNIHEVLERVYTLVQAECPDNIVLVRDYDPSIPELLADPDMLIQATLNLVRNAAQSLLAGGQIILRSRTQRQVTIGHIRHRLVARIDIIDNGPGIPETIKESIFYPMITGRSDGTGLGLPIAQSLVSQHGGLIEYSSQPDKTVFTIYLPLEQENEH